MADSRATGRRRPTATADARGSAARIASLGAVVTLVVGLAVAVAGPLPLWVQVLPLAVSVLLLGLPHGAVDHLVLPRSRGEPVDRGALAFVAGLYAMVGGLYAVGWFLEPVAAFVFFILLTIAHWGQGDLYTLLAFADADYLESTFARVLATVVRGSLPMLVPLVAFPAEYAFVADTLVGLFDPTAPALETLLTPTARLAVGVLVATLIAVHLARGVVLCDGGSAWHVDASETLGLAAYFALVPPIFAIGLYFCFWHSLRHVLRTMLIDDRARGALEAGRSAAAFGRFARDAAPLTAGALLVLAALALAVPTTPVNIADVLGLYLVGIAVLTLPHVVVVTLLDREQGLWLEGRE